MCPRGGGIGSGVAGAVIVPERRLWIGSGMGEACFLTEWLNLKDSGMMGGYSVPEDLADRGKGYQQRDRLERAGPFVWVQLKITS